MGAKGAFTPTFQGTIPDFLPEERDYTNALSLSRLAYDLEALLSPLLAGLMLTLITFHWLFVGTTIGFLASAGLVLSVALPAALGAQEEDAFLRRLTRGARIYLATPRLRGLLALSLAVASAGAMIIVNTVVYVRAVLDGTDRDVAIFFAAYGLGSMIVALALPRVLDALQPRTVMLSGGSLLAVALVAVHFGPGYGEDLLLWLLLGAVASFVQTPAGLLLRRSSHPEDRPAMFSAQFALSHACWLVTYPAAGWLGASFGLDATFLFMAVGAGVGTGLAAWLWPHYDPEELPHEHLELVHEHMHVNDEHHQHDDGGETKPPRHLHQHARLRHTHAFVIDDHHPTWPRQ